MISRNVSICLEEWGLWFIRSLVKGRVLHLGEAGLRCPSFLRFSPSQDEIREERKRKLLLWSCTGFLKTSATVFPPLPEWVEWVKSVAQTLGLPRPVDALGSQQMIGSSKKKLSMAQLLALVAQKSSGGKAEEISCSVIKSTVLPENPV